jgi:hypothetical protein
MNDSIIICPKCGGNACYEQVINENITNYFCIGCGFITNSLLKYGTEFYNEQWEILPELYKDISYEDVDGRIWIPNTINIENKGMIFANGDSYDWKWAVTKSIPIPENEKEKFKNSDGTYNQYKMDVGNIKYFESHEYIEALDYLDLLKV